MKTRETQKLMKVPVAIKLNKIPGHCGECRFYHDEQWCCILDPDIDIDYGDEMPENCPLHVKQR